MSPPKLEEIVPPLGVRFHRPKQSLVLPVVQILRQVDNHWVGREQFGCAVVASGDGLVLDQWGYGSGHAGLPVLIFVFTLIKKRVFLDNADIDFSI